MRSDVFLVILVSLFGALGCQRRELVGEWEAVGLRPFIVRFDRDGTFAISTPVLDGAAATGTYRLEGSKLTLSKPELELSSDVPPEIWLAGRWVERLAAGQWQLSWKTDDEIVLTGEGLLAGGYKRRQ